MPALLALSPAVLTVALVVAFLAGVVRGFTGFALSAVIIAALALAIPPIELLPVCLILELAASLMLLRGSFGAADRGVVLGLQGGSVLGLPIGLALTGWFLPETSKLTALGLVLGLATLQLARVRLPLLATRGGTWGTGLAAGVVGGLAGVGGMVIALYTLARQMPPAVMRGTMILNILVGCCISIAWQSVFGVMTPTGMARAAALMAPMLAGVGIGRSLFRPDWQRFYRPVCLTLLIGLAAAGLIRLAV